MKIDISKKKCKPCEGGVPLTKKQADELLPSTKDWQVLNGKLTRTFKFKDFEQAGKWLDKIRVLAEKEGHHPDIYWSWNKITLELVTHSIKGLSENDFILAAKINSISN